MDVERYARGWKQRIEGEETARVARCEDLLLRAARAAKALADLGARRIWLFGSLAERRPHARSDIDLGVEGLPAELLLRALDEATRAAGCAVDVVRVEEAPLRLREIIELGEVLA